MVRNLQPRPRCLRDRIRVWWVAAFLTGLGLVGCARQPAPQEVVAVPAPPKIQPEAPVKHVLHPVANKAIGDGRWFATLGSDCSGETGLRAADFELTLSAPTAGGFALSMSIGQPQKSRPSGPIRIQFHNSRDSWADAGRLNRGIFKLTLPSDPASLSKFLLLFEGGTLSLIYPGHNDRISVPRAGVAQQKWFDCAKRTSLE